jgi:hypothetical protein
MGRACSRQQLRNGLTFEGNIQLGKPYYMGIILTNKVHGAEAFLRS